jgi:hypothetical protein
VILHCSMLLQLNVDVRGYSGDGSPGGARSHGALKRETHQKLISLKLYKT